jgi:error-prone DNA polymerase
MVGPFLQRRHGFEEVHYPHPTLRPILAETHGVIVFHEQVIRVIAAATGCSLDDADFVRRHLDSERPSLPDDPDSRPARRGVDGPRNGVPAENEVGRWFKAAAIRNGHSPAQAAALWHEVYAFASFGFCKSHAAAFALPTYLSAWLKAHHPAEFLAGVLTHDPGMYPRRLIVADARQFGIPILPIDVNTSDKVYRVEAINEQIGEDGYGPSRSLPTTSAGEDGRFPGGDRKTEWSRRETCPPGTVSGGAHEGIEPKETQNGVRQDGSRSPTVSKYGIRLALSEVRDISTAEINSIVGAREDGPFGSVEELWRRAELSRPVLQNLAHVGALDSIAGGRSRREVLWKVTALAAEPRVRPGDQLSFDLDEPVEQSLPGLPTYTRLEETEAELEVSGIDARRHVMSLYAPLLTEIGCVPAARLGSRRNDSEVWIAGVKVASQTPAIRSGQRIIFVTLDDLTGPIDVTVFERVQPRCARTVFHSWLLLVRGMVRKRGGASLIHRTNPDNVGITVVVDEVFDLAELAADRKAGHSLPAALGRQRRKQVVTGLSSGAPERPESTSDGGGRGNGALTAPAKLWHSSGGSAGR